MSALGSNRAVKFLSGLGHSDVGRAFSAFSDRAYKAAGSVGREFSNAALGSDGLSKIALSYRGSGLRSAATTALRNSNPMLLSAAAGAAAGGIYGGTSRDGSVMGGALGGAGLGVLGSMGYRSARTPGSFLNTIPKAWKGM